MGCIRRGARVKRRGKWAEHEYKHNASRASARYPSFPAGTCGHAVNRRVAAYVASRGAALHMYQGEDVSLGIWLEESPLKRNMRWLDAGGGGGGAGGADGIGGAAAMFSDNGSDANCTHTSIVMIGRATWRGGSKAWRSGGMARCWAELNTP